MRIPLLAVCLLVVSLGLRKSLRSTHELYWSHCGSSSVFCLVQAEEYNAALVVMAAHNKGRLLKYLLGSATKYCVNHCRSTVLVHHL